MVVVAMSCLQETPARWVAIHRRHHQFADEQPDPHSPLASFFWGHIGWILVHQPELSRLGIYERYAKDILRDRFYVALERHDWLVWINLIQMPLFFAAGFVVAWLLGATAGSRRADRRQHPAVRRLRPHGAGLAHHLGGQFGDPSVGLPQLRDRRGQPQQLVVGLISNGEGWHNNHHADPRSARHGHRWWEMDNTWLTIRFLERIGLATDVVAPSAHLKAQAARARLIDARTGRRSGRLEARPQGRGGSEPKISKTTPCKDSKGSPALMLCPRKHFDTSGKSPALLQHRAT